MNVEFLLKSEIDLESPVILGASLTEFISKETITGSKSVPKSL